MKFHHRGHRGRQVGSKQNAEGTATIFNLQVLNFDCFFELSSSVSSVVKVFFATGLFRGYQPCLKQIPGLVATWRRPSSIWHLPLRSSASISFEIARRRRR